MIEGAKGQASNIAATKIILPPANLSHNTQGALNELPHNVYNGMDQSDGDVKSIANSTLLIPPLVIPWLQTYMKPATVPPPDDLVVLPT
ncbi:hypothetical protein DSO57_1013371 [Entomophthora muscae]|uniref:Uncharacterized protein n=1 Tax=Entomophthora muscae TaxID=34485 RepID=A0ACC2RKJ1_9FUNG|nr:hypothetical protein DSO57_1013371 [Entomophthora muscae]